MKINFYYRLNSNLLSAVDNLSEWSIHVRHEYRKEWITRYGLNAKEGRLLKNYSKLRRKYDWTVMDPWMTLPETVDMSRKETEKNIKPDEQEKLWCVFDHFTPRIKELMELQRELFVKKSVDLNSATHDSYFMSAANALSRFLGYNKEYDINVFFMHSLTIFESGGGANISPHNITLELSNEFRFDNSRLLGIMLHEAAHGMEKEAGLNIRETLSKTIGKEGAEIIDEAIMDSLIPQGIITERYLTFRPAQKNFESQIDWMNENLKTLKGKAREGREQNIKRRMFALKLLPLTTKYLDNRKPIDDEYLKKAIEIYKAMK